LNCNKIHFLGNPKGDANLGNRHGCSIHPTIQHIFTMNINIVVHKLIMWKGEEESSTNRRAPIGDLNEKGSMAEESLQN